MMEKMTLLAHGKLNLSLDITGCRYDGYHLMDMVMQSVSLSDRIIAVKENSLTAESFPFGEKDIAYKAARAFFEASGISGGIRISVEKRIPAQAGMAGGSADAAAVLIALNHFYRCGFTIRELAQIGVKVGADIPFCLTGGTARVSGIGEVVESLPFFDKGIYLIVKPPFGVSTPAAFSAFDRLNEKEIHRPDNAALIRAMKEQKINQIGKLTGNVLETAAGISEIEKISTAMKREGALFSLMTGSGSAVYGLFDSEESAIDAEKKMRSFGQTYLCTPKPSGAEILI